MTVAADWICPDCTRDLSDVKKHPHAWRFCPYTGRPRKLLHSTPQAMQRDWDDFNERFGRFHPTVAAAILGVMVGYSDEMGPDGADDFSYLEGQERMRFEFEKKDENAAFRFGQRRVVHMLRTVVEWRRHLVTLAMGERRNASYNAARARRAVRKAIWP